MRVAIDARHLGAGRGVARYLEEMLAALAAGFTGDQWVAVVPGDREVQVPDGVELRRTRLTSRPLFVAAALIGWPRLEELAGGADVCWIPAPAPVACGGQTPYVLTVHDRSFESNRAEFTVYERIWHSVARPRRLAAGAAQVVVDSQATATDLIAAGWPIVGEKLTVVPGAPSLRVSSAAGGPEQGQNEGPYLLYVGALEPRKGIDTLAQATVIARRSGLSAELVVVGEGRSGGDLEGVSGVRLVGRQSDAQLARWYENAIAVVMPSRLEGFGLPAVEAAAHGVPSVTSDLAVFRETLSDSAITFPVGDSAALAKALVVMSTDVELRNRLGDEARKAVARFSWTSSAALLRGVLAQAAGLAR